MSSMVRRVHEAVVLKGDEEKHEQTDAWSNRDLIPLPPARRTWGAFHYFGYWTLSSLNIATWQTPNTYLSKTDIQGCTYVRTYEKITDNVHSSRTLCWSSYGSHHHLTSCYHCLRMLCRLVRIDMAYWLYYPEQVHMGNERKLHSTFTASFVELHLECCTK